jgi:hypothetical protein
VPVAPEEANRVPADPGGEFELPFRFYSPERPLLDKTWVPADIEKTS